MTIASFENERMGIKARSGTLDEQPNQAPFSEMIALDEEMNFARGGAMAVNDQEIGWPRNCGLQND
jgi:hypothetical protein